MKTEHTSGNWIFSKYSSDYGVYSEQGKGNDIALVRGETEEAEANAQLIAAAPDLLNELINALKIIDRLTDDYSAIANKHANYTRGEHNKIITAIKKANPNYVDVFDK